MENKKLEFTIDSESLKKAKSWIKKQKEKHGSNVGAIGDRFSYEFIPTGLGDIIYCNDLLSNERICISNLNDW